MPCISSKRESFHPALHMCGQRDGASLTPTAVDTRLSARTTTAVLELPGRRAPPQKWRWPSSRCQDHHDGPDVTARGGGWVAPRRGRMSTYWLLRPDERGFQYSYVSILPAYVQGQPCSMECRTQSMRTKAVSIWIRPRASTTAVRAPGARRER